MRGKSRRLRIKGGAMIIMEEGGEEKEEAMRGYRKF